MHFPIIEVFRNLCCRMTFEPDNSMLRLLSPHSHFAALYAVS